MRQAGGFVRELRRLGAYPKVVDFGAIRKSRHTVIGWALVRSSRVQAYAVVAMAISATALSVESHAGETTQRAMVTRIDELLADRWQKESVTPASPCDDAEFLRRAYLDLIGRIPRVSECRTYFGDNDPQRRERLVDELTQRPSHATQLTNVWRRFLLPEGTDLERLGGIAFFETWLRGRFAENMPYNQLVFELLTADGANDQPGASLFFTAWELKPEKLAASTSRSFLGVQLQCAECHDHPFDRWSQRDFWGYASFFSRLVAAERNGQLVTEFREVSFGEATIPDTNQKVFPKYLGATSPVIDSKRSRRQLLARWITSRDNPYFARATVNRAWSVLFGRGLVHPADDMGLHNLPSHPQLLDELAEHFVESGYDLRNLFLMLAATRAYQLASEIDKPAKNPPAEFFARMSIKPMTAEQLYDSLAIATCRVQQAQTGGPTFGANRVVDQARQRFLNAFQSPSAEGLDYLAGVPQALSLMNGQLTVDGTDHSRSDLLASIEAPFFDDRQRLDVLFLATLSRYPNESELAHCQMHLDSSANDTARRQTLSDILWALLNSAEFTLNH